MSGALTWRQALDHAENAEFFRDRNAFDIEFLEIEPDDERDWRDVLLDRFELPVGADAAVETLQCVIRIASELIDAIVDHTPVDEDHPMADVSGVLVTAAKEAERWFQLAHDEGWQADGEEPQR